MRIPERWHDERGIALVLSLLIMMTASVLAASMMYLAQTETMASQNYRVMSQARYGAESGIHVAANFLLDPARYTPPNAVDPNYDTTKSPVEFGGQPVVLSSNPTRPANYPDAAMQTAFNNAAQGTLASGNTNVQYNAYVTMLSMQEVDGQTVLAWEITADGMVTTIRTATVEVSSVLEKQVTMTVDDVYAAFATGNACGALSFSGITSTNSYDSTAPLVGGLPVFSDSDSNVGTNGNLTATNSATINGTLSTPRVGVGACSDGNVTAETASGGATVTGGVVHLSQEVVVPTPPLPDPLPPTTSPGTFDKNSGCLGVSGCTLTPNGEEQVLAPGSYGNLQAGEANAIIHLTAGTYNINSLELAQTATMMIDSGPVIINVVGTDDPTPLALLNSSVISDPTRPFDPTALTINYAGTGTITWNNNTVSVLQLNAPNATVTLDNSAEVYGSIIGRTVAFANSATLHFDRHLAAGAGTSWDIGADMLTSFSWKKY